jgi:hypothetical protein
MRHVYVLESERHDCYKIGSGDTAAKLRSGQTYVADLTLVAAVCVPNATDLERRLHRHFKDWQLPVPAGRSRRNETFERSATVRAWVSWFESHRGTAKRLDDISATLATPDMWPWWSPTDELVSETGQRALDIPSGPRIRVKPNRGNGIIPASNYTDDWWTSPLIVELVRTLYGGTIDLDPMSCREANLQVVQAALFYTPDMDGLLHPWKGRVFLNPPWGDAQAASVKERAITKALAEYKAGNMSECVIVLNANATTTAWFAPLFQFPMCFPPQRIKHLQPGDPTPASPPNGTVLVYLGDRPDEFYRVFSELGAITAPYRVPTVAATAPH